MDYLPERNGHNLKIFVNNHILPGTNLTHDGWQGYNFLDEEDSVWTHECHNHGHGDFGFGSHSTSHIEAYWSQLKNCLRKLYPIFPTKGFIYYIREGEFRCKLNGKTNEKIREILLKLFKKFLIIVIMNFLLKQIF